MARADPGVVFALDDDDNEVAAQCSHAQKRLLERHDKTLSSRLKSREYQRRAATTGRSVLLSPLLYSRFKLRCELRIHEEGDKKYQALSHDVRTRSRILELTNAGGMIFILTRAGLCVALNESITECPCYLNTLPGEVVRSFFFNKLREEIILISVDPSDNFTSLQCRAITLAAIRAGAPEGRIAACQSAQPFDGCNGRTVVDGKSYDIPPPARLFASEHLKWPGFVEFDEINGKVLTFSSEQKLYTIWSLRDYQPLFTFQNQNIFEVKISPGLLLLVYHRTPSHLPLKILNLDNGEELFASAFMLHRRKKIEFVEVFSEKILIKQQEEDLFILDIATREVKCVPQSRFVTPRSFVFLAEKRLFLTVRGPIIQVWNFQGEQVTSFEDHILYTGHSMGAVTHINPTQDLLFSFCDGGSLNISAIVSGKLVGKITTDSLRASSDSLSPKLSSCILEEVCALSYNERTHEIYVGNDFGSIYILH